MALPAIRRRVARDLTLDAGAEPLGLAALPALAQDHPGVRLPERRLLWLIARRNPWANTRSAARQALDPPADRSIQGIMQKGLFSSLPSISNWPDRTDLSAASGWAARNGLGESGDFLALLKADGNTILVADGSGAGPDAIGTEAPPGMGTALAAALAQLDTRCLVFARPPHARALAALSESLLPPICPDSALFHHRHVVDPDFGGRPPEEEGPRLSALLAAPGTRAAVIGNHGVLTLGPRISQALSDLHRFERAAGTYLRALATGHALRILPDELAAAQHEPNAEAFLGAVKSVTGD